MYGKIKNKMGITLIISAFFFLFDPSYGLVDPLPDLIGYLILCSALINLADINDKLSAALKAFKKGIALSILRIVSYILLNKVFVDDEKTVGLLLFVFVFAALELFFIIPAYKNLFEGLLSLGMFEGGEAVYLKRHDNGKNISEKTYLSTMIFLIVKNTLWLIPELTTLKANTSYEFINIMRILSILIVLPFSLFWLVRIVKYFVRVGKDIPFIKALEKKYTEKAHALPDFFVGRVLNFGLNIFLVAYVLSFDFYSEGVNILPDLFMYITLTFSALYLKKYSKKWFYTVIISLFGALSSILLYITERDFYENFYIGAVNRNIDAYNHYYLMLSLYILQTIIFIISLICAVAFLKDVYISCRKPRENEHESFYKEKTRGFSIRLYIFLSLGAVSSFMTVYHIFSLPRIEWSWIYYYSGIISNVFSLAFIGSAWLIITYMQNEIKNNFSTSLL